ncbi:hypothetical protein EZS27_022104 [termite gut metagenome]|uniref:Uncharacterized protein n=1 Tax=termite gut metagenome TaxID=433724 RepID=A0A5J4R7G9_9ZZZZ
MLIQNDNAKIAQEMTKIPIINKIYLTIKILCNNYNYRHLVK